MQLTFFTIYSQVIRFVDRHYPICTLHAYTDHCESTYRYLQVVTFVDRYYPSYVQYMPQLYSRTPCTEDKTLRFWIDETRLPVPSPASGHDILDTTS